MKQQETKALLNEIAEKTKAQLIELGILKPEKDHGQRLSK